MHIVSMHSNKKYHTGRHIMMREIIPIKAFTDDLVNKLVNIIKNSVNDNFKCKKELIEFFTEIRDK